MVSRRLSVSFPFLGSSHFRDLRVILRGARLPQFRSSLGSLSLSLGPFDEQYTDLPDPRSVVRIDAKDRSFWDAMTQTDEAIKAFSATVQRTLTASGSIDHRLVLPHCFILAAMIQLHWILALEHDHLHPDYQKCLNAAIDMAEVVQRIAPGDYALLELHVGVSTRYLGSVRSAPVLNFLRESFLFSHRAIDLLETCYRCAGARNPSSQRL